LHLVIYWNSEGKIGSLMSLAVLCTSYWFSQCFHRWDQIIVINCIVLKELSTFDSTVVFKVLFSIFCGLTYVQCSSVWLIPYLTWRLLGWPYE
jgi:hypothetical protein